jgi:sodium-independent sulfate anion transporter 11
MAYAKLAELPVQYGLYSSFMGVLVYWFFATSKDITIGVRADPRNPNPCQMLTDPKPVAVMSTLTGQIILQVQAVHPDLSGPVIASALAIISGAIITFVGLIRWGWIVDFIPLTAISAYMTGSAINIMAGQVPAMLGESASFDTRAATYKVIINTLKYLPTTQIDAAMGLTALAMLYLIRSACAYAARKYPRKAKLFFFMSTLRTVFVILFYTMISAAVNLHRKKPRFKLLGKVPRGELVVVSPGTLMRSSNDRIDRLHRCRCA